MIRAEGERKTAGRLRMQLWKIGAVLREEGGGGVTWRRSKRRERRVPMMEEQSVLMAWNAAVEPYWVRTGADDDQYLQHKCKKDTGLWRKVWITVRLQPKHRGR